MPALVLRGQRHILFSRTAIRIVIALGYLYSFVNFSRKGMIMKRAAHFFRGFLVLAFMLAGVILMPAMGQEKAKAVKAEKGKPVMTVLAENDKVRVWELLYRPGDENTAPPATATRVIRVLKGGTQIWTYADGKTQKNVYKTGEVRIVGPGPQFTSKNVGKSEILLYVVMLK
jgi:hypothetical protein